MIAFEGGIRLSNTNAETRHGLHANIALFRNFLPYFRPYWRTLALDLFFAALTTLCDLLAFPLIIRFFTDTAQNAPEKLSVGIVLLLGGIYLLLRLIDAAANYYMQSIGHVMGTRIETDMRRDMFCHLQRLSHSFYDGTKIGQIMSRITTDLFDITEFAHHMPEEYFIITIKILVAFVILLTMNIPLTLIIFAIFPFMIFFSIKFLTDAPVLQGIAPPIGRIKRAGGGQSLRHPRGQILCQRASGRGEICAGKSGFSPKSSGACIPTWRASIP